MSAIFAQTRISLSVNSIFTGPARVCANTNACHRFSPARAVASCLPATAKVAASALHVGYGIGQAGDNRYVAGAIAATDVPVYFSITARYRLPSKWLTPVSPSAPVCRYDAKRKVLRARPIALVQTIIARYANFRTVIPQSRYRHHKIMNSAVNSGFAAKRLPFEARLR